MIKKIIGSMVAKRAVSAPILIKLLTKPFIIVSKGTGDYPSVTLRIRDYPETHGTMYLTTSNNYLTVESETAFGLTTIDGYKYGARRYTITFFQFTTSQGGRRYGCNHRKP